jgi:hypothetical protein
MESTGVFEQSRTISLLQSAYGEYQIGAFENFHQFMEDMLIVLRPRLKVFFQYELRFANRLQSQLLISHRFLLIKMRMLDGGGEREIMPFFVSGKSLIFRENPLISGKSPFSFGKIPSYFGCSINFCFRLEPGCARTWRIRCEETRSPPLPHPVVRASSACKSGPRLHT